MESIIVLIVCLALVISQIIMLMKSIKKKEKKYWISSFCLEILSIVMSIVLLYYYDYLAPRGSFMPGLEYIFEELVCIGAGFLYFIMLCITTIARIIVFKKSQKREGKKLANSLRLVIAFLFIMIVIICLFEANFVTIL